MSGGLRFGLILVAVFGIAFLGLQWLAPRGKTTALDPVSNGETASQKKAEDGAIIIDWRLLNQLDLETKRRTPDLVAVDGKEVRMAGFMVPLEDYQQEVSEFLLVPSPMMCIHVPAPPANQMVYVKMSEGKAQPTMYVPIWVQGTFEIVDTESPYGNAGFELKAKSVKPFSRLQK